MIYKYVAVAKKYVKMTSSNLRSLDVLKSASPVYLGSSLILIFRTYLNRLDHLNK